MYLLSQTVFKRGNDILTYDGKCAWSKKVGYRLTRYAIVPTALITAH